MGNIGTVILEDYDSRFVIALAWTLTLCKHDVVPSCVFSNLKSPFSLN